MKSISLIILASCLTALPAYADDPAGIHFEISSDWPQVLAKAKAENKAIFVDCYATWCAPCKQMDREVYTDSRVGLYFNDHFVSVKVQMDSTKRDDAFVQSWRPCAQRFEQDYQIHQYPTFLFISADGTALHKAVGSRTPEAFLALGKDAGRSDRQYYTLLNRYRLKKDSTLAATLAEQIKELDGVEAAESIAMDCIDSYLVNLPDKELLNQENLSFISKFKALAPRDENLSSAGRIFKILYAAASSCDVTLTQKAAQGIVDYVITYEEVNTKLWSGASGPRKLWKPLVEIPDWNELKSSISRKFGAEFSERIILSSKISWYGFQKDDANAAISFFDKADRYGLDVGGAAGLTVNNVVWANVFQRSDDASLLLRAAQWQQKVVDANPEATAYADTLANLLYKAGRVEEAIALEQRVVSQEDALAAVKSFKYKREIKADEAFRENLEKMEKGLPTWSPSPSRSP